jgi:hypothetical protein
MFFLINRVYEFDGSTYSVFPNFVIMLSNFWLDGKESKINHEAS